MNNTFDSAGSANQAPQLFRVPFDDEGHQRLDQWLTRQFDTLSRSRIQALIKSGQVTVDGLAKKPRDPVHAGASIEVRLPPPMPARPRPEAMPLDIRHEDQDILVLVKPPGLVVHPAAGHAEGTLVNALLHHCRDLAGIGGVQRPGIVHRLDKDTSGLLVVAKNDAAHRGLVAQFQNGEVRKTYLALAHGCPTLAESKIETSIGRHPVQRKRMAANPPRGRTAVSFYRIAETLGRCTLLRVRILTGRTHQIRVHLAYIGHPIVGDPLYGRRPLDRQLPFCPSRQMLHAAELAFNHPIQGRPMEFKSTPPRDMRDCIAALRQTLESSPSRVSRGA